MFLDEAALKPGSWDELANWLGIQIGEKRGKNHELLINPTSPRIGNADAWASMRSAYFTSRPAHADQLHVDLWYHGYNITRDAGTFQYNALPPWDNGLSQTLVHNTLTINKKNQMYRGGRFLWLDWAQSKIIEQKKDMKRAEHYGYKKLGMIHRRTLKRISNEKWEIIDEVFSRESSQSKDHIDLHWLLPDWKIKLSEDGCALSAPFGSVLLRISSDKKNGSADFSIFREGKCFSGNNRPEPLLGWFSPTYSQKLPAVSIRYSLDTLLP